MRLLLISEGPNDVGHDGLSAASRQGALRTLARRVLEERFGRDLHPSEIEIGYLPRVHRESPNVSGYARKVELAVQEGAIRGCTCVAIVVDRDRTEGTSRLGHLKHGLELAEAAGNPLVYATALGVAIETVEAWLLADEKALNDVLKPDPKVSAQPSPEGLDGARGTPRHPTA